MNVKWSRNYIDTVKSDIKDSQQMTLCLLHNSNDKIIQSRKYEDSEVESILIQLNTNKKQIPDGKMHSTVFSSFLKYQKFIWTSKWTKCRISINDNNKVKYNLQTQYIARTNIIIPYSQKI